MISLKGRWFGKETFLGLYSVLFGLSAQLRNPEEMMTGRCVQGDHSIIQSMDLPVFPQFRTIILKLQSITARWPKLAHGIKFATQPFWIPAIAGMTETAHPEVVEF